MKILTKCLRKNCLRKDGKQSRWISIVNVAYCEENSVPHIFLTI